MGQLKEAFEQGVAEQTLTARCGLCDWLATLDGEDAEYAARIIGEMRGPTRYKFSALDAAARLQRGGFAFGYNVVQRHRFAGHHVAA